MSQQSEITDIKKKILSTGIRVGTAVKTKFMIPFITKASPEGLYLIDLDITLAKIKTASKFINSVNIDDVIVCSGREYANTPIEKFCELTGAVKKHTIAVITELIKKHQKEREKITDEMVEKFKVLDVLRGSALARRSNA